MRRSLLPAVLSLSLLLSTLVVAQDVPYTFTTVAVPSPLGTFPNGINAAGQIVGRLGAAGNVHGFLIDGATFTVLDVPGARLTIAYGINDRGEIVGSFTDATNGAHGFVTDGVTFTPIDAPGAVFTLVHGINNRGQIVGIFNDATGNHGFVSGATRN